MDTSDDLVVDVRGLDPPGPMERVLEALPQLRAGQRLCLRIHREPFPLYRILDQNSYAWKTIRNPDGSFEVLIWEP